MLTEFPVKRKRQSDIEEPDSMERQVINVGNVTETRYNGETQVGIIIIVISIIII